MLNYSTRITVDLFRSAFNIIRGVSVELLAVT